MTNDVNPLDIFDDVNPLDLVRLFNTTGGQIVRDQPTFVVPERELRFNLIAEEIDELITKGFKDFSLMEVAEFMAGDSQDGGLQAFAKPDIVETIDACADIVYVVCGAALTHGVGAVDSDNRLTMEIRRPQSTFNADFRTDVQLRRSFGERMRSLLLDLYRINSVTTFSSNVDVISRLIPIWEEMVEMCYLIAETYKVDLDRVIAEVQASNMSKFGPNGEVYLREDGKIKKGPLYFRPDLVRVLKEQGITV